MELLLSQQKWSVKNLLVPYDFAKDKALITDITIIGLLHVCMYTILLYAYPYMFTYVDSETYLASAAKDTISGYRPFGYSWFIQFIHGFSSSLRSLFTAQFTLNALAIISLLIPVKLIFNLSRKTFYALAVLISFSGCMLFCTNYVMSDSLFASLTILFIASTLWIIKSPNLMIWLIHFGVLYAVINVRYAALFYPIISIIAILYLVWHRGWFKLIAVIPILLVLIIYKNTTKQHRDEFKVNTFSAFSGWALANNATAVIPHVDIDYREIPDEDARTIHLFVSRQNPFSAYSTDRVMQTDFMWNNHLAGKQYLYYYLQNNPMPYVAAWVKVGDHFKKYGSYIIRNYPLKYFKHFIVPNAKAAFSYYDVPEPAEFTPAEGMKNYYANMSGLNAEPYTLNLFAGINSIRQYVEPLIWILFFVATAGFIFLGRRLRMSQQQSAVITILLLFVWMYIGFSIISHPVNTFRYMMPIYFVKVTLVVVFVNQLLKLKNKKPHLTVS